MPLHPDKKAVLRIFQGLDHPVGSDCRFFKSRSNRGGGLMMEAVDREAALSQEMCQASLREDLHGMRRMAAGGFLPVLQVARSAQILEQGPAQDDVEHLQAAADTEKRQTPGQRRPDQGILPGVSLRINFAEGGVRFFPVIEGAHVAAPAEQQTIKRAKQGTCSRGIHRGNQERERSRLLDPAAVSKGQPEPAAIVIPVNGDPD